jgi:hypothetical protein
MEENFPFCPVCRAPQIKVSTPVLQPTEPSDTSEKPLTSLQEVPSPSPGASLPLSSRIDWKFFFRLGVPLAAVTGMLSVELRALGLFILLPAGLVWTISRYRLQHPGPLRSGQGARMGAVMALLSFGFFLLAIAFNPGRYRDMMITSLHESAARNPDPQAQQVLQWFATPDGMLTFAAIALVTVLIAFLVIGMSSGALAIALSKARNRT